ncbi:Crp/Fnr family transcriptional regulator [Brevundimonas sp. LM2]|uniref:Crp/Fnr family transcriptional regulator n=1 Tax=Brevundimonas sp. LM2 TaxID=1938605 RepID=UPI001558FB8D|nr:Crp/Fnr family transcriptional regulator [Brevundimonas sp. LM2]
MDVVYFPIAAELGNTVRFSDGKSVQAATVSRNGITGLAAFLAEEPIGRELAVQIGGEAWKLPANVLRERCRKSPPLMNLLWVLTHQNQIEASVNAACHLRHGLGPRLARWLLTTQDRTGKSELPVLQSDVADWLGVRRSSVVASFKHLSMLGALRQGRGRIIISDRAVLKTQACECYGKVSRRLDPHP